MKTITKILVLFIIFILLIENSIVLANVIQIGETKFIERGEQGDYILQYWNENRGMYMYIGYSQTYYTDDNGEKRIAYCTTPDLDGVGWLPGEYEGYDTIIQNKLSNNNEKDNKLWRVFKNGYPYVDKYELDVETDDDAYLATKQAAYFIIRGRSENEVYSYFKASEDSEWYKSRGERVINAIYKLVNIGNNGKDTMEGIKISTVGEITKDDSLSYQEYEVSNNNLNEEVEIGEIKNAPEGTYICNENKIAQKTFKGGEKFKIVFPNENVKQDYQIEVDYKATCKNYPVFFAKSSIEGTQDYLLSAYQYDDEYGTIKLNVNSKKSVLEIIKIDEQTKKEIPGVTFNIKYKQGKDIGNYVTDSEGRITLRDLEPGEIIITEIDTPEGYITNSAPIETKITYNQITSIEIDNKEAKPKVEVKKDGPEIAHPGEEIKYSFRIANNGNVDLKDFTWYDFLPYEKARITKIATGTFNKELEYNVYYKTSKNNEYILLKEKLNSKANNFIDISEISLENDENIVEIKFEFGDVGVGFKTIEEPYMYLKINSNIGSDEIINNKTKLTGKYRGQSYVSKDSKETIIQKREKALQKLPRTGF